MDFDLFKTLYREAKEYADLDYFISERGWQDWMNPYEEHPELLAKMLIRIYELSKMNIKELRNTAMPKLTQKNFAEKYLVPIRTYENWESNPDSVSVSNLLLISYTIFESEVNNVYKEN